MTADLWHHLFPPFDAWWPNIVAAVVWGIPAFVGQHLALRRHHRRVLAEHVEALHRSQAAAAAKLNEGVGELLGEALDAAHDRLMAAVADLPARKRRTGW